MNYLNKNSVTEGDVLSIIIDENLNVLHADKAAKKIITGDNLSEQLDESTSKELMKNIKLISGKDESIQSELEIIIDDKTESISYKLFPVDKSSDKFQLHLKRLSFDSSKPKKPISFSISTSEIEEYLANEKIQAVLEKIKSSYPFTFIAKQKFQREIDSLEMEFWLKNESGKYAIANKAFAKSFGIKLNQIIGKFANDIYNVINRQVISSVDEFIKQTSRSVLFELEEGEGRKRRFLQFALNDLDGNVVAILGFSVHDEKVEPVGFTEIVTKDKIINDFSEDMYVICDVDRKILEISRKLLNFLDVNENDIEGKKLRDVLPEGMNEVFERNIVRIDKERYFSEIIELGFPMSGEFEFVSKKNVENDDDIRYYLHIKPADNHKENMELKFKMYDIIMHTSPEPMLIYDIENLKFIEVNHAALKLYGYTRDDFLEMDLTDLYAPEDIQTLIDSSPSKTTTSEFTGPWRHKHKNGKTLLVEISKSTLEYEGRKAHFNIIRDVTNEIEERKRIQSYKSVYENTNDLVVNTDSDGFLIEYNDQFIKTLGYEKSDLENKPFLTLVMDSERAKINSEVFHSDNRNKRKINTKLKSQKGNLVAAQLTVTPIFNYENEIDSFNILIVVESSAAVKPRKTVESSPQQMDSSFLSNLFHELLTPINVIMGFTQEITDSIVKPSGDQEESIGIIKDNQKLLLQIMDNAIEYSNIEQNKTEINPEEVAFVKVVEEVEENIKKDIESRGISFAYGKISSSLRLETDRQKIETLTTLLVRFAVQATEKKKIYLSAYALDSDNCIISVKDERSSISQKLITNMEEIFTGDESIVKQKFGISRFTTRLGRKLIDLLGGEKSLIPDKDNPVEYGIKLPVKFPESKLVEEVKEGKKEEKIETVEATEVKPEEIKKPTEKTETQSQSVNVNVNLQAQDDKKKEVPKEIPAQKDESKKTVSFEGLGHKDIKELSCLYVEDQVDSQILFKVQMKDLKMIEFANSFEKALPMIQTRNYDFIVMDINLQGEYNGLDALRAIQKMPGYERMPIIAVTAYVLPGDREKFIAAGFADFITKPILKDKLESVLAKIFS